MDWMNLPTITYWVLLSVLIAEAANGWTDAPAGTSAAVASKTLTSWQALWRTALFNCVGLVLALVIGAKVAETVGTGIVRPELISTASIGVAMLTCVFCASVAAWLGLPVSKTHLLFASLAGIGYAQGGFEALLPASGDLMDSGWVDAGRGVFWAIFVGWLAAFVVARIIIKTRLDERISEAWWRRLQKLTVLAVASGHGFNDGLKYVGIFTLVLLKSEAIPKFQVLPEVIIMCAIVMGIGTLIGGWRIHQRLSAMVNPEPEPGEEKKPFAPFMGVSTELVASFAIWRSGSLGIPMSTNHSVVSAMAGAKSARGKTHVSTVVKILGGWIATYFVGFTVAKWLTEYLLLG